MKEHYEEYWSRPDTYVEADPLAVSRRKAIWETLDRHNHQPGVFLDAGCGEGEMVAEALERGWQAQGFDISDAAVDRARRLHPGVAISTWSVDHHPWPVTEGSCDVVTSFEVIEHLLHPRDLTVGSVQALKPGGFLFVSTPYHGVVKNVALSLFAFDKHFAVEGDHIRFFSDKALHRTMEETGFEVIEIHHFGRMPLIWANSLVVARKR